MTPSGPSTPGTSGPASDLPSGAIFIDVRRPYREGVVLDRCAAVESIEPPPPDSVDHVVVLAGDGDAADRTFRLRVPAPELVPFRAGDVIRVRVAVELIQIHAVVSALVTDRDGRLLVGLSGEGDTSWAPGWSLEVGRVLERSGTVRSHAVELTYLGTRAESDGRLVRVATSDGTWLVHGSARTLAPRARGGRPVVPPHDFSPYSTFAVLRVGRH